MRALAPAPAFAPSFFESTTLTHSDHRPHQQSGTWHFRTTFLPPEDKMDSVIERLTAFHQGFLDQYRGD